MNGSRSHRIEGSQDVLHAFSVDALPVADAANMARDAPFADWHSVSQLVSRVAVARNARVIGISGSQGSGKSTLAHILARYLSPALDRAAGVCSLDDFYLTLAERQALAEQVHPLLLTRGVPGTHDHHWLRRTLESVHAGHTSLTVPSFDKGLDDRSGERRVAAGALVPEGWCLGVTPQSASALAEPCNELERAEDQAGVWRRWVNEQVQRYYAPLWSQVDLWVHLRVPGFEEVLRWRVQQEQQLPAARRMDTPAIARFIQHYERLTRHLWSSDPLAPGVVVTLDAAHAVTRVQAVLP